MAFGDLARAALSKNSPDTPAHLPRFVYQAFSQGQIHSTTVGTAVEQRILSNGVIWRTLRDDLQHCEIRPADGLTDVV